MRRSLCVIVWVWRILFMDSFHTTGIELPKKIWGDEAPFLTTTSLLPGLSANSASRIWVLQTRIQFNGVGRNAASFIMDVEDRCLDSNQIWVFGVALRHLGKMSRLASLCWKQAGRDPFLKFPSQVVTNASVRWWCGCEKCDGTRTHTFTRQPIHCGSVDSAVLARDDCMSPGQREEKLSFREKCSSSWDGPITREKIIYSSDRCFSTRCTNELKCQK